MDPRARQLTPTRRRVARTVAVCVVAIASGVVFATPVSAQDTQSVSDTESTRTILLVVGGLVAMGVLLAVVTVWFWRSTRPDHPALAPLEVMGDRRFAARSAFEQRQILDQVRPEGAEVLRAMPTDDALADRGEAALDLQRLVVETPTTFEDLAEPAAATPTPTPADPSDTAATSDTAVEPEAVAEPGTVAAPDVPPPPPVPADR